MVSGLGPIQDFQQIMFSRAFAQRLYDFATGAQKLTDDFTERLMDYGLTKGNINALVEHLQKHGVGEKGVLKSVGLDKMSPSLQRKVQIAMHRASTHVVQEAAMEHTLPWMHGPIAKVVAQFRTFSLVALGRRTMHSLTRRDATAGLMLAYGMMWGALGLAGRTAVNYPEDHPYRKKLLEDPTQFAKSTFAAVGESSIMPMLWDSLMTYGVGADDEWKFNNFSRSTGNASTLLEGIPSVATGSKVLRLIGMPGKIIKGKVSEADMRATLGLIPLNNMLGVARFNRWWASQFPSERELQAQERQDNY
jgi:hypothetical protein